MDELKHEERDSKQRAKNKNARGKRASRGGTFDRRAIDWIALIALTETLCDVGGALRIGLTRDGGAMALGVYVGNEYGTEYIRPGEGFYDACAEISDAWVHGSRSAFDGLYNDLKAGDR